MSGRRRLVRVRLHKCRYWVAATKDGQARPIEVTEPGRVYEDAPLVIQGMHDDPGKWLWVTVRAAAKLGLIVSRYSGREGDQRTIRFNPPQRTPY